LQAPSFFSRAELKAGVQQLKAVIRYVITLCDDQPGMSIETFKYELTPHFPKIGIELTLSFDRPYQEGDLLVIPCSIAGRGYDRRFEAVLEADRTTVSFRKPGQDRQPYAEAAGLDMSGHNDTENMGFDKVTDADSLIGYISRIPPDQTAKLYSLFLYRLKNDFLETKDFCDLAEDLLKGPDGAAKLKGELDAGTDSIMSKFKMIRPGRKTARADIESYGILLYHLTGNPKEYSEHLYDQYMRQRAPVGRMSLGRRGISYQARGNSIVHVYPKKLVYGDENRPYLKNLTPEYENVDVNIDRENNAKLLKALAYWKTWAVQRFIDGRSEAARIEDDIVVKSIKKFEESTTVVELGMETNLIFSDPSRNVVRLIHAGRSRRVFYLSKQYLDGLNIDDGDNMRELAMWLNFAQRYLDVQDEMLIRDEGPKAVQSRRTELTQRFFEKEDSGLVDHDELRIRLGKFMKEDYLHKYSVILARTISLSRYAEDILSQADQKYLGRRTEAEGKGLDPTEYVIRYDDVSQEKRLRDYFDQAGQVYKKLMHVYEGLGLHGHAESAYMRYAYTVSMIQLCDQAFLPYKQQRELVLTALRFGQWPDFIAELTKFMTCKGYARKVKRSEISHIAHFITMHDPNEKTRKNFEDDVLHGLESHLQSSVYGSREFRAIKNAQKLSRKLFRSYKRTLSLGGSPADNFDADSINDDTSTQQQIDLASRMRKWLSNFGPSSMPPGETFRGWVLDPDMLFKATKKWWRDLNVRWSEHGGVDLCRYKTTEGNGNSPIRHISAGEPVPNIFNGTVERIVKDSIGSIIFVRHDMPFGANQLYTVFRYVDPIEGVVTGREIKAGEIIARVSDTEPSKTKILPHIHLSMALIRKDYPTRFLSWDTVLTGDAKLINPLEGLREGMGFLIEPIKRSAKKRRTFSGRTRNPLILTEDMVDHRFSSNQREILITSRDLYAVKRLADLRRAMRCTLGGRIIIKGNKSVRVEGPQDIRSIMTVSGNGATEVQLKSTRGYYDEVTEKFRELIHSWAERVVSLEAARDPDMRRTLEASINSLKTTLDEYRIGLTLYITKRDGPLKFTGSMIGSVTELCDEELYSFAKDLCSLKYIATKWHDTIDMKPQNLAPGEESISLTAAPLFYPEPPFSEFAPEEGRITAHIVQTDDAVRDELFLFYPGSPKAIERYRMLNVKFNDWQEDVRAEMRSLSMTAKPEFPGNHGFSNVHKSRRSFETGVVGKWTDHKKEFLLTESKKKPVFRNISRSDQLATNLLETLFTMMLEGKKIVLAFHNDLPVSQCGKIEACLAELERLKAKPGFGRLLDNLVILRPTQTTSLRNRADLENALGALRVDLNDPENTAIFMFAPDQAGNSFSNMGRSVHPVIIDEQYAKGKRFNAETSYYPILEMITITLIKYRKGYRPSDIRRLLQDAGIRDLDELNIGDINDNDPVTQAYLVFKLIPKIDRYNIEKGKDLYAILYKCLKTAV